MTHLPDTAERSVLFVAYHFPPMRSAGVERSAKFVRYLPEFGFAPQVLSTRAFGGNAMTASYVAGNRSASTVGC